MNNLGDFGLGQKYWSPYLLELRVAVHALTSGLDIEDDAKCLLKARSYADLLERINLRRTVIEHQALFVQTERGFRPRLEVISEIIRNNMEGDTGK